MGQPGSASFGRQMMKLVKGKTVRTLNLVHRKRQPRSAVLQHQQTMVSGGYWGHRLVSPGPEEMADRNANYQFTADIGQSQDLPAPVRHTVNGAGFGRLLENSRWHGQPLTLNPKEDGRESAGVAMVPLAGKMFRALAAVTGRQDPVEQLDTRSRMGRTIVTVSVIA